MDNHPTLRQQLADWCIHFTGLGDQPHCKAGISYHAVAEKSGSPYRFPCIASQGCSDRCPHACFPSEQGIEPVARMIEERTKQFLEDLLEGDVCPECRAPMSSREKRGRCTYALPCQCRIGQIG